MSWNTSSDGSAEADRVNIFLHNEAVRWAGPDRVLPVTIVTGALGVRTILTDRLRVASPPS